LAAFSDADAPLAHIGTGATTVAAPTDTSRDGQLPDAFEQLYAEHFDFVWRTLRRLGVRAENLDDAAQDVFIVMLRRQSEFRGQSSWRTWLFGIANNVTHEYRRKQERAAQIKPVTDDYRSESPSPLEQASSTEALRLVDGFLESLDENKRHVFIRLTARISATRSNAIRGSVKPVGQADLRFTGSIPRRAGVGC